MNFYIEEITDEDNKIDCSSSRQGDSSERGHQRISEKESPDDKKESVVSCISLSSAKVGGGATLTLTKENKIYLFGGSDRTGSLLQDMQHYHISSNSWSKIDVDGEKAPVARYGHTATLVNDRYIYVFGGSDDKGNSLNDLWMFDTEKYQWSLLEETAVLKDNTRPPPRNSHTTSLLNNKLIVFGGSSQEVGSMNDLWEFCLTQKKWTEIKSGSQKPSAREMHSACVLLNDIYIIGGRHSNGGVHADMWIFSEKEKEWKQLPNTDIPVPTCAHTANSSPANKKIYVFGGFNGSSMSRTLWEYFDGKWNSMMEHETYRFAHVSAISQDGNMLYIAGGVNSQSDLDDLLCFTLKK